MSPRIAYAALAAAALALPVPLLAQQGAKPASRPTAPPAHADDDAPPEPLLLLDEEGRLILFGDLNPDALDAVRWLRSARWRSRLSRKIETLIRSGAPIDPETYAQLILESESPAGLDVRSEVPLGPPAARSRARRHHRRHGWGHGLHRRRMLARRCLSILARLGLPTEEAKAVRPLLQAVLEAQRALAQGDWRARWRLRREADHAQDEGAKALLQRFRSGRRARLAQLAAARRRLRDVVTVKQEALLVVQGVLD